MVRSEARTRKSEETRERLLDAAAKVFRDKGYAGARLSDIAELAEMHTPGVYYYFPSKEDLVEGSSGSAWPGRAATCRPGWRPCRPGRRPSTGSGRPSRDRESVV